MATEKRLIDANFLDDRCRRQMADEWNKKVAPVSWSEAYKEFLDDVWDAPTVDAVEVVHGRWLKTGVEAGDPFDGNSVYCFDVFVCSECGCHFDVSEAMNYCPNCGADMRERKENNNAEN